MIEDTLIEESIESKPDDQVKLSRRAFVQMLSTGLLITVTEGVSFGQRSRGRGGQSITVAARLHINQDGTISVMTGKVEEGQGPRAELSQAAAEELHVSVEKIRLIMADTDLVPDDGITAGSRTTPYNVPAVRQGAAKARELLTRLTADRWKVDPGTLHVIDGTITHKTTKQRITYADLAKSNDIDDIFKETIPSDIAVTPVSEWNAMGTSVPRPNIRDIVTGTHRYPSDIVRPNMLYGKILRPPSYGATLESIDLSPAKAMKGVIVLREGDFVGCAAPSSFLAEQALKAVSKTASWKTVSHPSSKELYSHLKKNARTGERSRPRTKGSVDKGFAEADKVLSETYDAAYIQHTPMEPRAAVAEWKGDHLTVWAGVDWPQRAQRDLARVFDMPLERVRAIVPDMGGGFGGKHSAEAAEEAARLA